MNCKMVHEFAKEMNDHDLFDVSHFFRNLLLYFKKRYSLTSVFKMKGT